MTVFSATTYKTAILNKIDHFSILRERLKSKIEQRVNEFCFSNYELECFSTFEIIKMNSIDIQIRNGLTKYIRID